MLIYSQKMRLVLSLQISLLLLSDQGWTISSHPFKYNSQIYFIFLKGFQLCWSFLIILSTIRMNGDLVSKLYVTVGSFHKVITLTSLMHLFRRTNKGTWGIAWLPPYWAHWLSSKGMKRSVSQLCWNGNAPAILQICFCVVRGFMYNHWLNVPRMSIFSTCREETRSH